MAEMRPLTEEEKTLSLKSIERMEKENENLAFFVDLYTLNLDRGLKIKYEAERMQLQKNLIDTQNKLQQNQSIIAITKNQIENGVAVQEADSTVSSSFEVENE